MALVTRLPPVGPAVLATPVCGADPMHNLDGGPQLSVNVAIGAQELDEARQQIQPSRGALQTIPQGENTQLNQVLLQAPGVAPESFGQIHFRGEHANVQYRLDGVEPPEGLSVFGQAIESRFANGITPIAGSLPAHCYVMTFRVVDIWTKARTEDRLIGRL